MRKIHPVFPLWALIFPVFSINKYSQNILEFFKLTASGPSSINTAPQSIDFEVLTQAHNSIIPLVELKDGKKQPLAALIEKKRSRNMHCIELSAANKKFTHLYETIGKKNPVVADNMPAANVIKNNHQSITTNNKQI